MDSFVQDVLKTANDEVVGMLAPKTTYDQRVAAATFVLNLPYKDGKKDVRDAYLKDHAAILTGFLAGKV